MTVSTDLTVHGLEYLNWKPWFAWRPVKTQQGKWLWLRRVYRRKSHFVDSEIVRSSSPVLIKGQLKHFVYADAEAMLVDKLSEPDKKEQLHRIMLNPNKSKIYASPNNFVRIQEIK